MSSTLPPVLLLCICVPSHSSMNAPPPQLRMRCKVLQMRRALTHHHQNIFLHLLEKHEDGSLNKALPNIPLKECSAQLVPPLEVFAQGYANQQDKPQENFVEKGHIACQERTQEGQMHVELKNTVIHMEQGQHYRLQEEKRDRRQDKPQQNFIERGLYSNKGHIACQQRTQEGQMHVELKNTVIHMEQGQQARVQELQMDCKQDKPQENFVERGLYSNKGHIACQQRTQEGQMHVGLKNTVIHMEQGQQDRLQEENSAERRLNMTKDHTVCQQRTQESQMDVESKDTLIHMEQGQQDSLKKETSLERGLKLKEHSVCQQRTQEGHVHAEFKYTMIPMGQAQQYSLREENSVERGLKMIKKHTICQQSTQEGQLPAQLKDTVIHMVQGQQTISENSPWEILQSVLQIARHLPTNTLLGECIDSFVGHIDTQCGNEILRSLGKEQLTLQALSFFEWMRMQQPSLLNSKSFCSIITILGQAKMPDRALMLFRNMPDGELFHCVNVYNALISALANNGRHDEATFTVKEMARKNILPDSITFSILMTYARKSGYSLTEIWKIFGLMGEKHVPPNIAVFGSLIKAFCDGHLRQEALVIAREMEERQGFPLNVIIYNTLIDAYGKEKMLEEAEGLFLEMREKGLRPTISTYNSLIDAYGRAGRYEVAESILLEMQDWGLSPDVISYSSLISAYGRQKQSEKAANAFLRMKKNGIAPNTQVYTALIHAFSEGGWHVKAEAAFQNMLREGLTPTSETYTALLDAYRQAGDLQKLMHYWKMMRKHHCMGTRVTFNILLDAFAKRGSFVEARDVIFEFGKLGFKPDRLTYNMLINAYSRGGQHEKISDIIDEMRVAGIFPDSFTFTTIIYSFLRVRDFTQAFSYFEQMCQLNQQPDRETYLKLKALIDLKYAIKKKRDQRSVSGQLRQQQGVSKKGKKAKKFWKRNRPMHRPSK